MRVQRIRLAGTAMVAIIGLTACFGNPDTPGAGTNPRSAAGAERDVEDPSIFSRRDQGLWDGRPSLGGVWVAHPDATTPERVIIRNTQNNQETIGALFRRERDNPGPAFQVSNEAANAISMLAGAPTMIEVVALRTEDSLPQPAEAAPQSSETPEAEGRIAIAEGEVPPTPAAAPAREGGLFARLFGRSDAAQSRPGPAQANAEIRTDALETEALAQDATDPDESAMTAPFPTQARAGAAPASGADAAPARPAGLAQATGATALARPLVQLGIFSVEANARQAVSLAEGAGLEARVITGEARGNSFWRVVVGPARSESQQSEILSAVRNLGFGDAYPVSR